jgi:hypothetical protein
MTHIWSSTLYILSTNLSFLQPVVSSLMERHASVATSITILKLLVCVFVVAIQRVHAHHCSCPNHARHSLIIVVIGTRHWVIEATSWFQTVEVVAKTSDSLPREDAEDISLMLSEFYWKVSRESQSRRNQTNLEVRPCRTVQDHFEGRLEHLSS